MRYLVVLFLSLFLFGCPSALKQQALVANAMAIASNEAIPLLADAELAEGLAAIADAPDADAGRAALEAIEEKWRPVWLAVEAFAQAHGTWVDTIESGGELSIVVLLDTYCGLVSIAKPYAELPALVCP